MLLFADQGQQLKILVTNDDGIQSKGILILAKALAAEVKNERALGVLNTCLEKLPPGNFPYDPYYTDLIEAYFLAGDADKAVEMTKSLSEYYFDRLNYYLKQNAYVLSSAEYEIQSALQYASRAASYCQENGKKEIGDEITKKLEAYYSEYIGKQQVKTE